MHPQTAAWLQDIDFTDSDEVKAIQQRHTRTVLSSELVFTSMTAGHPLSAAYQHSKRHRTGQLVALPGTYPAQLASRSAVRCHSAP